MPAALKALLVLIACYGGAIVDTSLRFPEVGAAILFLPYAIVTAALLRSPPRQWWIILVAASLGDFLPHRDGGASVSFFLLTEAVNHLRALIAAIGLRLFAGRRDHFDTTRGMGVFLFFAVCLAPSVAAFAGAGVVAWRTATSDFWLTWQEWLLSNVITGLSVLPLLMIDLRQIAARIDRPSPRRLAEASLLLIALVAVGAAVFVAPIGSGGVHAARLYWPLPILLWAALRFGPRGTSLALLSVTTLTIWGAISGRGPFATTSATDNLLQLQLFLVAISVPLLLLSVLLREQIATVTALAESRERVEEERLQREAQTSIAIALRDADQRKDEFLAMLGHELRNPLTPIGIAAEVLREAPSESPAAIWARDALVRQVRQVTRLVDDLLDVSRITLGKIQLRVEPLDLAEVVANAVETTQPLMDSLNHKLTVSLPERSLRLDGDALRLTQVVSNLLNNAAKYTPPGGHILLTVRHDAGAALLSVRDDGIGIAPEDLAGIFDLFRQVPAGRDHSYGGLGVGLTLVKRLVELHGGRVDARSAGPQKGTEVIVRLPAPRSQAVSNVSPRPAPTPTERPGHHPEQQDPA